MTSVTCLLPTYNRYPREGHLVEESVKSFLEQNYEDKKLLILNDTPNQTLVIDHPRIRVINTSERYASLLGKWFALANLADTELVIPWDDDDVYLPHRIEQSVSELGDAEFWMPPSVLFWKHGELSKESIISFDISICRRVSLLSVESSVISRSGQSTDWDIAQAMLYSPSHSKSLELFNAQRNTSAKLSPFYIYRQGVSTQHMSLHHNQYSDIGAASIVAGTFNVAPSWSRNWPEEAAL